MLGDADIAGIDWGAAEAELEAASIAATPLGARIACAYKRAWGFWFDNLGADVVFRRNNAGGAPWRINTKAFFRPLMEKELAGGLQVSDLAILVDPRPLAADASLEWPPRTGDKIVRSAGGHREHLYTVEKPPVIIDVAGIDLVVRLYGRGGG